MPKTPQDYAQGTVMMHAFSADGSSFPAVVGLNLKEAAIIEAQHINRYNGHNACYAYMDEVNRLLSLKVESVEPAQHDFSQFALIALKNDPTRVKVCQGNMR